MSNGALHELRPRSAVELYDAALHLCVHTRSELPVLALLGAAPVASAGIWLVWLVTHGERHGPIAALFTAALVFRQLCQGAGGLAATRELEGKPISALGALRAAAARLPSMIAVTAWLAFFQVVAFVATLGLSIFFLSPQLTGPILIAEGSAHGWNFGRIARERLKGRGGAASSIRLLHGLALLFLLANLHGLVMLAVMLAHSLFGLDVTFVDRFASLSHAFYDVCLFAAAQLLLDPVRCASSALLLADARVRHEGFDLLAALQRLRESSALKAAAVLLLALGALWPVRAHAAKPQPDAQPSKAAGVVGGVVGGYVEPGDEREDPVDALQSIADELGNGEDRDVQEALDRADALPPAERAKLVPLVRSLDKKLDAAQDEAARAELKAALAEVGRISPRRDELASSVRADPRGAVQKILAQPEFQDVLRHAKDAADPKEPENIEPPSWWTRFWKWVERQLKKLFDSQRDKPDDETHTGPAVTGDVAQVVTYILVGVAACVILVLLYRLLTNRKPEQADADGAGGAGAGGTGDGEQLDALSKPAWVWSDEADKLAAAGRFREAIRSLYLALLASLHRRGTIDYHPALSNWDYCEHFRGEAGQLEPFRELTLRFDFGWYGRIGTDPDGYGRFKTLCGPFLQGSRESEAARA